MARNGFQLEVVDADDFVAVAFEGEVADHGVAFPEHLRERKQKNVQITQRPECKNKSCKGVKKRSRTCVRVESTNLAHVKGRDLVVSELEVEFSRDERIGALFEPHARKLFPALNLVPGRGVSESPPAIFFGP